MSTVRDTQAVPRPLKRYSGRLLRLLLENERFADGTPISEDIRNMVREELAFRRRTASTVVIYERN